MSGLKPFDKVEMSKQKEQVYVNNSTPRTYPVYEEYPNGNYEQIEIQQRSELRRNGKPEQTADRFSIQVLYMIFDH